LCRGVKDGARGQGCLGVIDNRERELSEVFDGAPRRCDPAAATVANVAGAIVGVRTGARRVRRAAG